MFIVVFITTGRTRGGFKSVNSRYSNEKSIIRVEYRIGVFFVYVLNVEIEYFIHFKKTKNCHRMFVSLKNQIFMNSVKTIFEIFGKHFKCFTLFLKLQTN